MFYRIIFILAGIYNLVFGIWLFSSPLTLFAIFKLDVPFEEMISKSMGILIAVFSVIYFYAAWKPENSKKLILLGLVSKIFPSIALFFMIWKFDWPAKIFVMIFFNDWIWLIPFILFLTKKPAR